MIDRQDMSGEADCAQKPKQISKIQIVDTDLHAQHVHTTKADKNSHINNLM